VEPKPITRRVCANCRYVRDQAAPDEPSFLRAWCPVWSLLIPDPAVMGCSEFEPREAETPADEEEA
jgi:hypothetical protein